ncbi:MAG: hypothetical protein K2W82_10895 [Candidatus Obscuribacterales bacterium]|nr:hypothetical protein [Candidatus Obscuribacterales bacterium]
MAKINHDRLLALSDNLLRATEPSVEPDDQYRPSDWANRMYYLVKRAGTHSRLLSQLRWDTAAAYVSLDAVSQIANWDTAIFEQLEQDVAALIKQRFGE